MKVTPVLVVNEIESILPLWEALGFTRVAEVPHGDRLGFVILDGDGAEIMYQTVDSVRADEPLALEGPKAIGAASLFIEVPSLDDVVAKLPAGRIASSSAARPRTARQRRSFATPQAT